MVSQNNHQSTSQIPVNKKNMRSRIFLIILFIFFAIIGGLFIFRYTILKQSQASTSFELSDRATEFIDSQQKAENPLWSNIDDEESSQPSSKREAGERIRTDCFELTLPFVTKQHKQETRKDGCVFYAGIMSPPSNLAITLYPLSNDDPHISMRRKFSDVYQEFSLKTSMGKSITGFKSEDSVVVFVPNRHDMMSIAISNLHQVEKLSDSKLVELIDSISYLTSE